MNETWRGTEVATATASGLLASAVTLVSGLLAVVVAALLAVVGGFLATRRGRSRPIGVGLVFGALLTLAVLTLVRIAGD